jgi:hypothetical protein
MKATRKYQRRRTDPPLEVGARSDMFAMGSRVRALAVGCALLGVFAISFDIMWQRQRRQDLVLPFVWTPPAGVEGESSRAPAVIEAAVAVGRHEPPIMQPMSTPPRGQPAAGAADPGTNSALLPLPVAINIWNRERRHKIEGSVQNLSLNPITVSARVRGAEGREVAEFQLIINPGDTQLFSTDSGLEIHSKDEITFESSPYLEQTQTVP